jgi:hypothetical protein
LYFVKSPIVSETSAAGVTLELLHVLAVDMLHLERAVGEGEIAKVAAKYHGLCARVLLHVVC